MCGATGAVPVVLYRAMADLNARLAKDLERYFPDLVRIHQDAVFSVARRFVPSREDAQDVTQETFVRAHRALSGYRSERILDLKTRPWLARIAVNLCRNRARDAKRRPHLVVLPDGLEPEDRLDEGPAAHADRSAEAEQWRERLAALPPAHSAAVVLRHVWGLPYAEVAEALDVAVGTAKANVHRGLASLRAQLEAESTITEVRR